MPLSQLQSDVARYSAEWWRDLGIKLGLTVAIALIVTLVLRIWVARCERRAKEAAEDSMEGPRRRRLATIAGLLATTLQVILWIVILFYVLAAFGVPLGPLFASAGVAGVALGFGAQTLVRDTLAGLFIALEGQFDVGDVIELQRPAAFGQTTRLIELPVSWSLDDYPHFEFIRTPSWILPGLANANNVLSNWIDDYRYLRQNLEWGVITYTFHPFVIGRGHRMFALEKLITTLKESGAVFVRMEEAAAEYDSRCPVADA